MALMPEQPFLVYPSQALTYGLEGALLLQRYQQLLGLLVTDLSQPMAIVISREQWLQLVPFWSEEQLAIATGELVAQQAIDVGFLEDGQVQVSQVWPSDLPDSAVIESPPLAAERAVLEPLPASAAELPDAPQAVTPLPPVLEPVDELPVYDMPPAEAPSVRKVARRRINPETLMQQRGPAPTFGGSTGWRRQETEVEKSDELHQVFNMREEHNQKLHPMFVGWKPSDTFFELLPRHAIPNEYAEECLDEFTLYWLDKDRKESNWDQKFLAWVKREWIRQQTREARQRNQDSSEPKGTGHENARRDTRENRKRVTAAIMDIKDTDW